MLQLLAKRLAASALILFGIAAITFVLLYLLPADPAAQIAGRSGNAQTVANVRHELGLDQPLTVQFVNYLSKLAKGDLGRSYTQKTAVSSLSWHACRQR
jgi:peptide/nickel transport system permease protein